jgi:O-6-methylguanine DNA methyltransferase
MRHLYTVPQFGVGEVWTRDGMIIRHELACEALRLEQEQTPAASASFVALDEDAGPAVPRASTASPDGGARLPARTLPGNPAPVCDDFVPDLCRRVVLHLSGVAISYEGIPIDLEWATPLQRAFAAAARAIPWGEIVSYGELAVLAGRPGAARAAGSFCAENRFSLIIPCHRVVAANGIGGYGASGVNLKRRLLSLEGVRL